MGKRPKSTTLQAGVVPYRTKSSGVEFCLITSIRKGAWGFPKGIIDPGDSAEETALKEAEEEAGLHGHIEGDPLGGYDYSKWGVSLTVCVYLMNVSSADDDWEEATVRRRQWCDADSAREQIGRKELRGLLDVALQRIESECR